MLEASSRGAVGSSSSSMATTTAGRRASSRLFGQQQQQQQQRQRRDSDVSMMSVGYSDADTADIGAGESNRCANSSFALTRSRGTKNCTSTAPGAARQVAARNGKAGTRIATTGRARHSSDNGSDGTQQRNRSKLEDGKIGGVYGNSIGKTNVTRSGAAKHSKTLATSGSQQQQQLQQQHRQNGRGSSLAKARMQSTNQEHQQNEDEPMVNRTNTFLVCGYEYEVDTRFTLVKPIGKGAYGVVCSALDTSTNERVAIKKISNAFDNYIDAKRTLREIKLLRHLRHENVIMVKDVLPPADPMCFDDVYIAYELMDTDLHQIIRSSQPLSDDHSQYFIYQLLRGLKYIHSANVLHRDLKVRKRRRAPTKDAANEK